MKPITITVLEDAQDRLVKIGRDTEEEYSIQTPDGQEFTVLLQYLANENNWHELLGCKIKEES